VKPIYAFLFISVCITLSNPAFAEDTKPEVDDKIIDYLMELEGIRSIEVDGKAVSNAINRIVISKGKSPNYLQLLNSWKSTPEGDTRKVFLALGMFSAGISNAATPALEFASSTGDSFYNNDFKLRITKENLAGDAYSWLIDNVDFTVPKSLVKYFPKIVSENTPYWGGTRDGYFNIEDSSKWNVFSSSEHKLWLTVLDDIESPDKEAWRGTSRNMSLKSIEIFRGLLVHNPSYLMQHIDNYDFPKGKHQWLNYWGYSGAYEYVTQKRYQVAKSKFYESLKQQLLLENNNDLDAAETLANLYFDLVEMQFTGHTRLSEQAGIILDGLKTSTWQDLVGKQIWNHSDDITLKMVGGMLLIANKEEEFISYIKWLFENEHDNLIGELIGLAAISGNLTRNIVLEAPQLNKWGDFNKTPLMYAAHFNNLSAYNKITELYTAQFLQKTSPGEEYDSLPKIGDRNVLMYALENAELPLINRILSHSKVTSLNLTDSANRDLKQYLKLNKLLSDSDKSELELRLKSMSVKEPSLMDSTLNNLSKYWKGVWEFFEA